MKRSLVLASLGLAACTALPALAQTASAHPQLGRNLAATCANCHGTDGQARGDMKPLAGMPADKLIAMVTDYRNGNQPATIMHQIAKGYTDDQIRLVAAFFAALPAKK
jgi:cytochrome subunit of sulfide dehydrogenase